MRTIILGTALILGSSQVALSQVRAELPIKEVMLTDGARRYSMPVTIGSTPVEVGLDTGSTGLRIMPGTLLASAEADGADDHYSYGAGTELRGQAGHVKLSVGPISGTVSAQLVKTVDCVQTNPHCPASRIPIEKFGIQGDGLPGEGFKAIFGFNMAEAEIQSPLIGVGVKQWIVELPRGDGPGKLILNPNQDELQGYVWLPIITTFSTQKGDLHDAVKGCLLNDQSQAKACGAVLLDTGAPGIRIVNGTLGREPWPNGTQATLGFFGSDKIVAMEALIIGQRAQASRLEFGDDSRNPNTVIYSGLAPYFAFDVAYDPDNRRIGLKPRSGGPGSPTGTIVH